MDDAAIIVRAACTTLGGCSRAPKWIGVTTGLILLPNGRYVTARASIDEAVVLLPSARAIRPFATMCGPTPRRRAATRQRSVAVATFIPTTCVPIPTRKPIGSGASNRCRIAFVVNIARRPRGNDGAGDDGAADDASGNYLTATKRRRPWQLRPPSLRSLQRRVRLTLVLFINVSLGVAPSVQTGIVDRAMPES
jgi:hypothetical protein